MVVYQPTNMLDATSYGGELYGETLSVGKHHVKHFCMMEHYDMEHDV